MSSIYPEKIAMYFSSMNPLSAKIFADIKAVEETASIDNNLSFSEKSRIIDKHLIHDVIRRNQKKQQREVPSSGEHGEQGDIPVGQIYYEDPELNKDHVTALLTSVYPKKPEKYIYDDNSFYLDEHSEPFSYCSQSQTNLCDLEHLVKNLPLPSVPLQRKSDSKSRLTSSHHREKKPAPLPTTRRLSEEVCHENTFSSSESIHSPQTQPKPPKKSGFPVLGIPMLGLGSNPEPSSRPGRAIDSGAMASSKPVVDEANLPKQVQNSDLIAELQQKLKMNKGKSPALKHTPSTKVNKPKAPPPPPPKQEVPGGDMKVGNEAELTGDPHENISSNVEVQTSSGKSDKRLELGTKKEEEFSVDVSSPCRIATPKTGFDFLDNW
ncbi:unnamed protein product [Allacma fusca]|uniref:DUF4706 domain-containing protein n=1 Tax=Allacma fusca TaxID=39272 RepID=A0A8J2NMN3_9HEXA|nr:unnamed protein product [Allacma fusca]